ncbi:hypothetical protein SAMN04488595_101245 [Ralstonia sp. 25mfcol4.1]|uniref:hypothetical protein n=1 Tax=Ralstonia sp. 25mfcol4.1 TaxID=1761899 RepID=UPI00088D88A0|nr:hypothetical protein [Ralstonia sp. 25mfcol4.1]SDO61960.1 hypothetical protein SAMN04488595_101245 [Ralstonia sp. 25mfcol4.1]
MTTPLQSIGNRLAHLRRDALAHFGRHGLRDYPSRQVLLLGNRLRRISDDAEALGLTLADLLTLLGTNRADWLSMPQEVRERKAKLFDLSFVGTEWSAMRRRDAWNTPERAPLLYVAGALILESMHTPEGEVAYRPVFDAMGFR